VVTRAPMRFKTCPAFRPFADTRSAIAISMARRATAASSTPWGSADSLGAVHLQTSCPDRMVFMINAA
jgi:hypothetical protein